jgi:hypothetical protein
MLAPTYFCSSCTLIFRLSAHDDSLGFNFNSKKKAQKKLQFKNGGLIF